MFLFCLLPPAPSSAFPGAWVAPWELRPGEGKRVPLLLLTEAVVLLALCVYLEKSKHSVCVYSLTQWFGRVQFLP